MRRPGADEAREAMLQSAAEAAQVRDEQQNRPPTQSEMDAARMLVDGFGLRNTQGPRRPPWMASLHEEFIRARENACQVVSPLYRTPPSPYDQVMPRSTTRFRMARDWDQETPSEERQAEERVPDPGHVYRNR